MTLPDSLESLEAKARFSEANKLPYVTLTPPEVFALIACARAAEEFRDQMLGMYGAGIGAKVYELDDALAQLAEVMGREGRDG